MKFAAWLQQQWFQQRRPVPALWLLLPLHALFVLLSGVRRLAYRWRLLASVRLPVPVVVVGNLIAGGAGKTPVVLWLAETLRHHGKNPGIISRGYGGQSREACEVAASSAALQVGDEPVLLARRSGVPVWVGADRVEAATALLAAHPEIDCLIADDGLQHYRLERDAEIVVFDSRGIGNGWRLPLGPLREPCARLCSATAVVLNGQCPGLSGYLPAALPVFDMRLLPGEFVSLHDAERTSTAAALQGKKLHALAGIGNPGRFFDTLSALGLEFVAHAFPDHHVFTAAELDYGPEAVLLMTEKDAVKCRGLTGNEAWVLPVRAELPAVLAEILLETINGR